MLREEFGEMFEKSHKYIYGLEKALIKMVFLYYDALSVIEDKYKEVSYDKKGSIGITQEESAVEEILFN